MACVEVALDAGACFGVERALRMVSEQARQAAGPVGTLGPLIHNPVVVAELKSQGVDVIDSPAQVESGSTLFMRTHGVAPAVEDEARARGAHVLDATCPFVKKVHVAAQRLAREGYTVFVVGEDGHPEVEGTVGHAPGAKVVGSAADVNEAEVPRRVGLVVQTTLAVQTLREVVAAFVGRCEELRVINTICDATSRRQTAAAELARRADVMVVIGGRNSANTTHLADICRQSCARTHHIERPEELCAEWFENVELVGVTAGASTPQAHIEAVCTGIQSLL